LPAAAPKVQRSARPCGGARERHGPQALAARIKLNAPRRRALRALDRRHRLQAQRTRSCATRRSRRRRSRTAPAPRRARAGQGAPRRGAAVRGASARGCAPRSSPTPGRRRNRRQAESKRHEASFPGAHAACDVPLGALPALEAPPRRAAQRAEHVFGGERINELWLIVFHLSRHCRSEASPRRIQLLMVPSGSPVTRAMSACE
jgi:hypothetical protein